MAQGGKIKGSGNKAGSIRPSFTAFWTEKEIFDFMQDMKKRAKKDPRIAIWVGDHLFGKSVQPIGTEDGKPLIIQFSNAFKHDN